MQIPEVGRMDLYYIGTRDPRFFSNKIGCLDMPLRGTGLRFRKDNRIQNVCSHRVMGSVARMANENGFQ